MKSIQGEWNLVGWERKTPGQDVVLPFGKKPKGLLIYAPDKSMAVQMIAADRAQIGTGDPLGGTDAQKAAAYSSNLSYFGRYEVEGDVIVHAVTGSAYPDWSGTVQRRSFVLDGDRLVLKTIPAADDETRVVNSMFWVRSSAEAR
ncbi:lipocalin-like domain-containing protein [Agrobacterium larrymoorei]|uniref:lipocalin-like domain-containing protein n=1 Tax=Agrobacterium larrymoorei TaxID=160699 RepID=UPI0015734A38|nr:lipocalin-like domain-containing protein [Agrobacterium larrymoorei]NTJ44311.1 lipocalin-like domain-containing protein [Agrobacterium larrymoorei]